MIEATGRVRRCVAVRVAQVHDPASKVVGVGFKKTGLTTLGAVLGKLGLPVSRESFSDKGEQVDALLADPSATGPALRAAALSKGLIDGPWSLPAVPLYPLVAERWPV